MANNEKINYDKAICSLALIEYKNYIQTLMNLDKELKEANMVAEDILKRPKTQETVDVLKHFAFTKYAKVQKYFKEVKQSIMRYEKRLESFLQKSTPEHAEYDEYLELLLSLLEEKEKFVKKQIDKCFEYIHQLKDIQTNGV